MSITDEYDLRTRELIAAISQDEIVVLSILNSISIEWAGTYDFEDQKKKVDDKIMVNAACVYFWKKAMKNASVIPKTLYLPHWEKRNLRWLGFAKVDAVKWANDKISPQPVKTLKPKSKKYTLNDYLKENYPWYINDSRAFYRKHFKKNSTVFDPEYRSSFHLHDALRFWAGSFRRRMRRVAMKDLGDVVRRLDTLNETVSELRQIKRDIIKETDNLDKQYQRLKQLMTESNANTEKVLLAMKSRSSISAEDIVAAARKFRE